MVAFEDELVFWQGGYAGKAVVDDAQCQVVEAAADLGEREQLGGFEGS